MSQARYPAVFVLGVAHCGSTLLGRMLDRHPQILCVGEILRLDLAVAGGFSCSCGTLIPECPFWARHLPQLEPERGHDYQSLRMEHVARIARAEGADVALDLSKTRVWRHGRSWGRDGAGFILLVRDSRGVLAATKRAGRDLAERIPRHRKWMRRLARFAERNSDRTLVVRYEDLCAAPERQLARVTDHLGLPYDEVMLQAPDRPHHFVHSSASGYLRGSTELRTDERWRTELDAAEIAQIERAMARVPLLRESYLEPAGR